MTDPSFILALCGVSSVVVAAVYAAFRKSSLDEARSNAQSWKEERDAERFKADRLEGQRHAMEIELAELRGKTDLTALSRQIDDTARAFTEEVRASFSQLGEEHRALLAAMEREAKLADERHISNHNLVETIVQTLQEERRKRD